MKLQFERRPHAVYVELREPGECDRIITVDRASDAFRAFELGAELAALGIDRTALKPLDALFSYARVVRVEVEQRAGGWCVEVAHWSGATGTLAQYETGAAALSEALARCVWALAR